MLGPLAIAAVLLGPALPVQNSDADDAFFETSVRPILAARCYDCHSADAKRVEGNLKLDTRAAAVRGGDSGPALDVGDPSASWLLDAVRYQTYGMPPSGPLPDAEVAVIEEWIRRGGHWPEDRVVVDGDEPEAFDIAARTASHWAWRPLSNPPVPDGPGSRVDGGEDPVDAFIRRRLDDAGLSPVAEADRGVWLRRVTFAIRGLPPTPAEQTAFAADESRGAHERVVDRLLAEPQFGETWGRHWLDVVRYAETHGHEFDHPIPHAAGYRDWVIRALNEDLPYDRFAAEQIAGDRLPPRYGPGGVNEAEVATGFWFLGEAVHAPTDVREDQSTRIENQIDTYSKAFLGLTVACARCHDHKFDAVSTADYYALYGVLKSTRRRIADVDPGGHIARAAAEIDALLRPLSEGTESAAAATIRLNETDVRLDGPQFWTAEASAFAAAEFATSETTESAASAAVDWQRSRRVPVGVVSSAARADRLRGVIVSRPFTLTAPRVHLRVRTGGGEGPLVARLVIDGYFLHEKSPLLFKGTRREKLDTGGRWQWVTFDGDTRRFLGQTVTIEVTDGGERFIEVGAVVLSEGGPPEVVDAEERPVDVPPATRQELERLVAAMPRPVAALAAGSGPGIDEPVHIRGNAHRPGRLVPRRFLEAVDATPYGADCGRAELARQTVDNRLFARVAVNRVWHHLFGRGLVASVDDFGVMGEPPSHPHLLDRLARDFIDDGYSVKRLIRRLTLSRTYRRSSRSQTSPVDPANRLLRHFPVRRLPAEAIRDAMLAVSGRLDLSPMTGSVPVYLDAFSSGRGRPATSGPLDGAGRRSVYGAVRRNFLPPSMLAFDFPSPAGPAGRRSVSNVPSQSLSLMNGPLAERLAGVTARRVIAEADSFEGRLRLLTRLAFAREASDAERARVRAVIDGGGSEEDWSLVVLAYFNAKEFIYLR